MLPLSPCGSSPPAKSEPHRSPNDLVVLPDARRILTANQTSDSVSLLDVRDGKVLAEVSVGHKPTAVAVSRDGKRAVVSNLWTGTVTLLDVQDTTLKALGEVEIGALPRGVAFDKEGETFFVAVSGLDEVACVEWTSRKVTQRWPAAREPHQLVVSPDGRWLVAASTRSGEVRCWDVKENKLQWERGLIDAFNLRGLAFEADGQAVVVAHGVRRSFPVSPGHIEQGWVIDSRVTRFPIKQGDKPEYSQIALDVRHLAVGDPHGVAFRDRRWLAVAAGGTHELLLLPNGSIPWNGGDPGDFLDVRLELGEGKMRRVELGGRPLTVAALGDGDDLVIANSLLDAVQVVDAKSGKLTKTIALGGPAKPSPARQGEALFYDARRSLHQWFSCNTCHSDGHTSGQLFDTLNDDSYGNAKLTPTLRGVTKTAPYTWHGWQKDLGAAVKKSYVETMFGKEPTDDEIKAVVAFLGTLDHPPSPYRGPKLSAAMERGKKVFESKGRCLTCHKGEEYTSKSNYDVKVEEDGSPYTEWNPPSLRGVWDRGPYMHDARARTLTELLETFHSPEKLGGEKLSDEERADLIAFLKSL